MKIKPFKIISALFYTLVIAFIMLLAGSLILDRLDSPIKYRLYSIQSGSMEPKLPVGSVILVAPATSYQEGDIINFRDETNAKQTVTHRIVTVSKDVDLGTIEYRTKGDANEDSDLELIRSERVNGKVIFHLPYLGYPIAFAQTQNGFIALVIIPATLIIYTELLNIKNEISTMFSKKKKESDKAEADSPEKIVILKPNVEIFRSKKANKK